MSACGANEIRSSDILTGHLATLLHLFTTCQKFLKHGHLTSLDRCNLRTSESHWLTFEPPAANHRVKEANCYFVRFGMWLYKCEELLYETKQVGFARDHWPVSTKCAFASLMALDAWPFESASYLLANLQVCTKAIWQHWSLRSNGNPQP